MKRFFSLILCLTLLLTAAACGDGGRNPSGGSGGRTPSGSGHSASGAASSAPTPTPTPAPTPEPTPEPLAAVLPDPYFFFDRQIGYHPTVDGNRYFVEFQFNAGSAGAGDEYIALLQDPRFGLTVKDSEIKHFAYGSSSGHYTFDYADTSLVPDVVLSAKGPASLIISFGTSKGESYWIQLCFAPDGFTFADFGDRTTYDITSIFYSGKTTGLIGPDKFGEGGPSGGSGGNTGYCTRCGGTGKVRCTTCGGNGLVGYGYGGTGRCSACSGNGKVKCSACNGTGK